MLAVPIFAVVYICLIAAKVNPSGFNVVWRYFGWSNQTLAVFALPCIAIYFLRNGKKAFVWMPLIPLVFYAFITTAYLLSAEVGFALPLPVAYIGGALFALAVTVAVFRSGRKNSLE